jgi:hypothetical protein
MVPGTNTSREHIESALRTVDSQIGKGEHRLFEHDRRMEKLKNWEGDLTMAHYLKLNLETSLRLMRAQRERLLRELE